MYHLKTKIGIILISILCLQCNIKKSENTENTSNNSSATIVENIEYFKDYYPSGNIKVEGQFTNTKKTGKWILYYENGEVRSIENFKNGKRNGYHKTDYSGDLQMEGLYKDDVKVGTWKSCFKETKALKYLKHFDENGNATGEWKNYYDTGEIASIENYENGKPNGTQIQYIKNGKIHAIGTKVNGRENGLWKYYYDSGTIRCEKEFKNGIEQGKYIAYFENGKVHEIGNKINFKKSGSWKIYNQQGDLIETTQHKIEKNNE